MSYQKFYPTIVISDVHLGTEHSKTTELTDFLRTVNCDTLIMNGDIIDGWHLQKSGKGKCLAYCVGSFDPNGSLDERNAELLCSGGGYV